MERNRTFIAVLLASTVIAGSAAAEDITVFPGDTIEVEGGGGGYGGGSDGKDEDKSWHGTIEEQAELAGASGGGGGCRSTIAGAASKAAAAFGFATSITGRATAGLQGSQIIQLAQQILCHTEEVKIGDDQLEEQRRMTAGIGRNAVGSAGSISGGVADTLKLSNSADIRKRYQDGASGDLSPDASLAYHQALQAETDAARRNALDTAAKNAAAERAYAKMADDALALSQSAQGQTAAQQAQTQMDRAREGAAAARNSTQVAFEHARQMTEEENRAGERIGKQRRDRLYRRLSTEGTDSQPFDMFQ